MSTLEQWLDVLLERGGSDLHVGCGSPPMARIHGELLALSAETGAAEMVTELLANVGEDREVARYQRTGAVDVVFAHQGKARFRACFRRDASGPRLTLRALPLRPRFLEELELPAVVYEEVVERRFGLTLVAGGPRSGKTTTAAALLDAINRQGGLSIATVEERVELEQLPQDSAIAPIELGSDCPDLATALEAVALDDIDVLLVDELPSSPDEVGRTLSLVEAGVRVLATVRAKTVTAAVRALVQAFDKDMRPFVQYRLANTLGLGLGQELRKAGRGSPETLRWRRLPRSQEVAEAIRRGDWAALRGLEV